LVTFFVLATGIKTMGQGTAFMYQGRLNDGGTPANGAYDLRFALFDAFTNGNAIGLPQTNLAVPVSSGIFSTNIDFGPVFNGNNFWLSIGVRTNGNTGAFTLLFPRQPLSPVPYAIFANTASNLVGTLSATQLVGTLSSAQISGTYSGFVNFTNSTNVFVGKFTGNGGNLTNLNGSAVAFGTVADARLSGNVALLNTNQTFTGTNTFTGPNLFTGANSFTNVANTFTGSGSNITGLNASALVNGTVADARLSSNVPLLNTNQTFTGTNIFTGTNTFTGPNYFTGANSFTNPTNAFTGFFFGNGLVGWIPVSGVSTQAVRDAGYMLLNSYLTTVTLPTSASLLPGDIVRLSGAGSGGWRAVFNSGQSGLGNFASFKNFFWPIAATPSSGFWTSLASSADGNVMWAAGNINSGNGGVCFSTDSGKTWTQVGSLSGTWQAVASSDDGTIVYAAPTSGMIRQSTDGGQTWNALTGASTTWQAIACSADGTKMVAAPASGNLYTLVSGSMVATFTGSASWSAAAASADGSRFAVASGTVVEYSLSGGASGTWVTGSGTASGPITGLAASSDGLKLVASINGSSINISTNFGVGWKTSSSGSHVWTCIAGSSDCGRLIAGVNTGMLYGSSDFGTTWSPFTTSSNLIWSAVALSDDATKAAASSYSSTGNIFYSTATSRTVAAATNSVSGGQGAAVELQYIGNGQFMPIGGTGAFWAN
jgi:hypothetical protein